MNLIIIILVLPILLSPPAYADLSFKVRMEMGAVSLESAYYLKDNRIRVDHHTGVSAVILLNEGRVIMVDRNSKTYFSSPLHSEEGIRLKEALNQDALFLQKKAKVVSLKKKGNVSGLTCDYQNLTLNYGGIEFDYTVCAVKEPPPEIKQFKQFTGDHFPEWVIKGEGKINKVRMSYEVLDVSFNPVSDRLFTLPSGYREYR